MPELPENEAQRRYVEERCLNRTIVSVELGEDVTYITLPGDNERARLAGRQFTEARRYGKNLFLGSKTGPWMAVHLGMTGKLIAFDAPDDVPSKTKLLVIFEGDRRLAFRCPRKLGKVRIIDDPDDFIAEQDLGPDALTITKREFADALSKSRSPIKSALLDQGKLAGVGNLWSDEVLFHTSLAPTRKARDLGPECIEDIRQKLQEVLRGVIDTDATYSKLPEDWLIRHRKKDASCRRCGGKIASAKVGGRTAYFCTSHQS